MKADKLHKFMGFMVNMIIIVNKWRRINSCIDECQTKYGNANVWKYCCSVFDYLTLAAVSTYSQ